MAELILNLFLWISSSNLFEKYCYWNSVGINQSEITEKVNINYNFRGTIQLFYLVYNFIGTCQSWHNYLSLYAVRNMTKRYNCQRSIQLIYKLINTFLIKSINKFLTNLSTSFYISSKIFITNPSGYLLQIYQHIYYKNINLFLTKLSTNFLQIYLICQTCVS